MVASILVYIETEGEQPSRWSLEALGEGRRMATGLGALLCACIPLPAAVLDSAGRQDTLARILGRAGADRVMLMSAPERESPAGWGLHGELLDAACSECEPLLVLLAASSAGRDIGPRLAARLGAVFVAQPRIEYGCRGEVVLARALTGGLVQRLSLEQVSRPTVLTLTPRAGAAATGGDEAELMFLDPPLVPAHGVEYLHSAEDPGAALETARIIVLAGSGVAGEGEYALVSKLAAAMGAELATTRALAERGLAPPERVIGVGIRHVAPDLYIACGASGSSEHLGAVSPDATIVAINTDPRAPIFRVASYGIVGEIASVVPDLIASLEDRAADKP